jgi:peptide/nickel transport system permease protein
LPHGDPAGSHRGDAVVAVAAAKTAPSRTAPSRRHGEHPIRTLVLRRSAIGIVTLFVVSIVVFLATQVLPGNAAYAVLGHSATRARILLLEQQMHLNRGLFEQYWSWISGILTGRAGTSFANGESVWALVGPRLANSAALVVFAGLIGSVLGVLLGAVAALRKDGVFDHITSAISLAITSLPEFIVALILILLFSTFVFHLFPGVSLLQPGQSAFTQPRLLALPVATLVLVIIPYILRMMRAAMIEALESDYVEMARLKGLRAIRIALVHALPNAIAPTIQVIGLNFLYLAGGIVLVEYIFNYPGIGQGLVNAVDNRDIPTIQFIVLVLAAFYVFMNILTDMIALLATPRRRIAR